MKHWEYLVLILPLLVFEEEHKEGKKKTGISAKDRQNLLNTLGKEGWELVSVVPSGAGGDLRSTAYLKREII